MRHWGRASIQVSTCTRLPTARTPTWRTSIPPARCSINTSTNPPTAATTSSQAQNPSVTPQKARAKAAQACKRTLGSSEGTRITPMVAASNSWLNSSLLLLSNRNDLWMHISRWISRWIILLLWILATRNMLWLIRSLWIIIKCTTTTTCQLACKYYKTHKTTS